MFQNMKFQGVWTIKSENILTGEIKTFQVKNLIVQGFYDLLHRFLSEDQLAGVNADDMNITHLGLGDGTTPPQRADTTMEGETERVTVTVKSFTDNQYDLQIFIDAPVGNFPSGFITEIGIFTKGTATLGSGTLISRVITQIQKNANIRLTLFWSLRGL